MPHVIIIAIANVKSTRESRAWSKRQAGAIVKSLDTFVLSLSLFPPTRDLMSQKFFIVSLFYLTSMACRLRRSLVWRNLLK
jgi:hypothetical protein